MRGRASPASISVYESEGDRIVTHYFACLDRAYRGWRWAVTVTRASRAKKVTVSEAVLLPGSGALLAPEWLPWSERLRPGDLGVGDLLPTADDDDRLAPGFQPMPKKTPTTQAVSSTAWAEPVCSRPSARTGRP
ncbi:hypothetical protein GCM10020220_010010 [Nonomuraea rubra]